MNRKNFIQRSILGSLGAIVAGKVIADTADLSTYDKLMEKVGFNHLPNKEVKTMKTILHKAASRGHANHGWLDSKHTFSFANYHNPERMHFGVLRVLNDDKVAPGMGFGKHPHDNMEIISIPLSGDLEHEDSMGNKAVIKQGDVQVMSAGTGIFHSEFNKNKDKEVKFLQIWVFPNKKQVEPRYDQITLDEGKMHNQLSQILSPNPDDDGVWIHQNAWFNMGKLDAGTHLTHAVNDPTRNGVYAFVIEGDVTINGQELNKRDGFGIWETESLTIQADSPSKLLLMEVPLQL